MKLTIFSIVVNGACMLFCFGLLLNTADPKPPQKKQVVETIHRIPFCESCGQRMKCPACEAADFRPRIKLILPPPESVVPVVPEPTEPPPTPQPSSPLSGDLGIAGAGWL